MLPEDFPDISPEVLLEMSGNGFLIIDHTRGYIRCNSIFIQLWGIPSALLEAKQEKSLFEFISQRIFNPQKFTANFLNPDKHSEGEVTECLHLKDGRILELTSKPIRLGSQTAARVWSFRDITARKRSEVNLRNSEERFSLAMRGANDGLWDWDLETDEVYYSPRWKNMLGYAEDELDGHLDTWKKLVHADDREAVLSKVYQYIFGQLDSFEEEMRMQHRDEHDIFVLSRAFLVRRSSDRKPVRLVGTHVDITSRKVAEAFADKNAEILEMIATGVPACDIYDEIALMYEARNPGMRCSMLELHNGRLMHGGAPSLPKEYCQAVHGLKNGPNVGSCGTSTYTGKRVLVENIETDPKWAEIKHVALPHGMRCCWSEPIKNSSGKVLGAFGMYYNHPALPNEEESNDLKSAARLAGIGSVSLSPEKNENGEPLNP